MLLSPLFCPISLSLFLLDLKMEMKNIDLLVFGYQCSEPLCLNVLGMHEGKEGLQRYCVRRGMDTQKLSGHLPV